MFWRTQPKLFRPQHGGSNSRSSAHKSEVLQTTTPRSQASGHWKSKFMFFNHRNSYIFVISSVSEIFSFKKMAFDVSTFDAFAVVHLYSQKAKYISNYAVAFVGPVLNINLLCFFRLYCCEKVEFMLWLLFWELLYKLSNDAHFTNLTGVNFFCLDRNLKQYYKVICTAISLFAT